MQQPANTFLAQLNVATALDDMDSERLSGFVNALDAVNEVAERSPGFVWRLKDDDGNDATSIQMSDNPRFLVNMSVWETPKALEEFVWNTIHKKIYNQKSKWFEAPAKAHFVMWWVPQDYRPTAEEALARLDHLNTEGPSEHAFGWESLPEIKLWRDQQCA
jgi:hypothetical protein